MKCGFFFNGTATTEISTLSLHDALPISRDSAAAATASGDGSGPGLSATPTRRDDEPEE